MHLKIKTTKFGCIFVWATKKIDVRIVLKSTWSKNQNKIVILNLWTKHFGGKIISPLLGLFPIFFPSAFSLFFSSAFFFFSSAFSNFFSSAFCFLSSAFSFFLSSALSFFLSAGVFFFLSLAFSFFSSFFLSISNRCSSSSWSVSSSLSKMLEKNLIN